MGKRASLSDYTTKKVELPPAPGVAEPSPSKVAKVDNRKPVTLRLEPEAWRQLKVLAMDAGCTSHELIREGVNMMFKARGKSPIA